MIIVVGGIKGGSGKTTVATNLAVMRSLAGRDVLLIDADDQETATDFTALRGERRPDGAGYTSIKLTDVLVRTETMKLRDRVEDIIIDTGGRDTASQRAALSVADCLLVPFVPRSFDVWTLGKVESLVGEMMPANPALRAYVFLNRGDSRGQDNDDAAAVLRDSSTLVYIDAPLGSRKAFANAAADGRSVAEYTDPKATAEMSVLYRYVFDIEELSSTHQNDITEAA